MADARLARRDGRTLCFRTEGSATGHPVFYLHGVPGSRLEIAGSVPRSLAAQVRVVAPERPGYGNSTPCDGCDFRAHAGDIAAIADALGLERFSMVGHSGGGVYALACAALLGRRVERLAIAGTPATGVLPDPLQGTGELARQTWRLAREEPAALAPMLAPLTVDGDTLFRVMYDGLPPADQALLADAAVARRYRRSLGAAVAQGGMTAAAAIARDLRLVTGRWGFPLARITQPVAVFHGTEDHFVASLHAEALVRSLGNAVLHLVEGQGHMGTVLGESRDVLWRHALPPDTATPPPSS